MTVIASYSFITAYTSVKFDVFNQLNGLSKLINSDFLGVDVIIFVKSYRRLIDRISRCIIKFMLVSKQLYQLAINDLLCIGLV